MTEKSENSNINDAVVVVGNHIAVKRDAEGTIVEDNFYPFWSTFWDGLQYESLSFADAITKASQHKVSGANGDFRFIFCNRIGVSFGNKIPLNQILGDALNAALVDPTTGYDRYMEGWEQFWQQLRNGATLEQAITRAITPERRFSQEAGSAAIGRFINRYRGLGRRKGSYGNGDTQSAEEPPTTE